jgi:hypothetical protein
MTGTLREDQYTFMAVSRLILVIMKNVSEKFMEKIRTHILCSIFIHENRALL